MVSCKKKSLSGIHGNSLYRHTTIKIILKHANNVTCIVTNDLRFRCR